MNSTLELDFPLVNRKPVICRFDGESSTSDAGFLLVSDIDHRLGLTAKLAAEVYDPRQKGKIVHAFSDVIAERVYAIAAGYEDANDLDTLGRDPALLVSCNHSLGEKLASQPTISRLENWVNKSELLFMAYRIAELVVSRLPGNTRSVVLDVDATDDPCHDQQEFEQFNGFYGNHCYLPLYLHVTGNDGVQRLVAAMLRKGNASSKTGLFAMLRRVILILRERFPRLRITLRADGGFGDGAVVAFCREQGIGYILGLRSNACLERKTADLAKQVKEKCKNKQADVQEFISFFYKAKIWKQEERVVAKVETVRGMLNIRYVIVSRRSRSAKATYAFYCARGDQENRIKETKKDLLSGRTSCHRFLANQFRLLLHAAACVLLGILQEALAGTRFANAQIGTLRLRLLKVGACFVESRRRMVFHLPRSCPVADVWQHLHTVLQRV